MLTFKYFGCAAIAAGLAMAVAIDTADARRGGGGGMRGGGFHGGGARVGGGARFAGGAAGLRPSHPIAGRGQGGWANRPGWGNRPGYGSGWANGYRPGYGWGAAAAVGAGVAAGAAYGYPQYGYGYGDAGYGYGNTGYYDTQPVAASSDAAAECARRFKTYDPASGTYIRSKGVRVPCP